MRKCCVIMIMAAMLAASCAETGTSETVSSKRESTEPVQIDQLIQSKVASLGPEYNQPRILNNLTPEIVQPGFPKEMADTLKDYTFYKITFYFDKNGEARLIAFHNDSNKVLILPSDIKKLHFPEPQTPDVSLAKVYIVLSAVPGSGLKFLSSQKDIDNNDDSAAIPPDLERAITAPVVIPYTGGVEVIMFTWQKYGGLLKKWRVQFSNKGSLAAIHADIMARRIGNFRMRR